MTSQLDRFFALSRRGTDVATELRAGATTFLAMAYIAFVNPQVLAEAGMPFEAVFAATCLAAAFGTLVMGFHANLPVALAPGMGLNAFFAYVVVLELGHSWEVALGAVFVAGLLFVILSVLPVRRWIVDAVPVGLKMGIAAGIGLFLGLIALRNAGIVQASPTTLVTAGDLLTPAPILAFLGFCLIVALAARRVPGATLVGVLGVMAAGIALGVSEWHGLVAAPPDPAPTLLAMDIAGALRVAMIGVIVTFLMVDFFDTTGTLIGVARQANLLDAQGRLPRFGRAVLADSSGTVAGAMLGTSPVTSYVESAAGTSAGGRTGLTACVVAVLFVACLFFAPLAQSIPPYATAPAILYVACLMTRGLADVDWGDVTESSAAAVTVLAIPLTFSIADGIGIGVLAYVAISAMAGRVRDCSPVLVAVALLFALKFALF